jgi:hypothetical protein
MPVILPKCVTDPLYQGLQVWVFVFDRINRIDRITILPIFASSALFAPKYVKNIS